MVRWGLKRIRTKRNIVLAVQNPQVHLFSSHLTINSLIKSNHHLLLFLLFFWLSSWQSVPVWPGANISLYEIGYVVGRLRYTSSILVVAFHCKLSNDFEIVDSLMEKTRVQNHTMCQWCIFGYFWSEFGISFEILPTQKIWHILWPVIIIRLKFTRNFQLF